MDAIVPRTSPTEAISAFVATTRRDPVAPPPVPRTEPARDTVEFTSFPASPPDEVRAEVSKAAELAQQLADNGRELNFRYDEEARRVIVEVRDLEGAVVRTIPPSHALAAMAGELEI